MSTPTPGISVRRKGSLVAIEDYDVEHGKAVLTRISLLDGATAVRIGHALVRLGTEASQSQNLNRAAVADPARKPPDAALNLNTGSSGVPSVDGAGGASEANARFSGGADRQLSGPEKLNRAHPARHTGEGDGISPLKTLELAPHADPYPEDRAEASREGPAR